MMPVHQAGIFTLTWCGRREGDGRHTVPVMLGFGCPSIDQDDAAVTKALAVSSKTEAIRLTFDTR
jgi:hypothetical protein